MAPSIRETVCKHFSKIETELSIDDLRKNFSYYVQLLHDQIYEDFLVLQDKAFNKAFSEEINLKEELSFEKFDKFFLSLSQSRRVRSGGVFEIIIEKLLNHLSYPLDIQKKIGKKKVDFVLPSIDFFQNDPLNSILLSAKRTFRERWYQVAIESNLSNTFFLATIDPNITQDQLDEIQNAGIYVVNTKHNIDSIMHYQTSSNVMSYEYFIFRHLDHQLKIWEEH